MDKATFEQLYRDMLPGLYRLAQSMLRQTADAQDAVQQAAVKAWLSLERIRPGGERAYFTRIVINECRKIQRQRMRQTPVESVPERAGDAPSDDLKLAVAALPEELRLPLLMKYMEGYREREIAEALNIKHRGRFYVSAQRTVPCVEDYDMKFLKTAGFPFTSQSACGTIQFVAMRAKPG